MTIARILLADDHELFRDGLAGLINAQPDLEVIAEAGDGLEALKLARDLKPDLIVMDINMPICDGLEATRLICTELPGLRIVILTVHDEDEKLFAAIKAGAIGYLLKSTNKTKFLGGIRMALAGEAAISSKMATRVLDEFSRMMNQSVAITSNKDVPDLTLRERDVLQHIATGSSDKEIAAELSISLYTVKSHVRNILGKLHAANRREAARLASRHGLLDD
ncbi:MAG: response regulator transcription factor [Anaerolineae bacterium]|nr:response regulator transcription factor [Anaerolineae bacterium]MBT7072454.1 response regulator transcription factor [Anaerolineae bacterium]MBT7989330.1 response regulator transcription factor [Anaerolineae bacterium]